MSNRISARSASGPERRHQERGWHGSERGRAAQRPAADRQGDPGQAAGGFPKFDPAKPDATDYQLQEAIVLAKAMAAQKAVTSN